MKKFLSILAVAAITICFASCSGGNDAEECYLNVSPETMTFNETDVTANVISVSSNYAWVATVDNPAMIIDRTSGAKGENSITVSNMPEGQTCTITITSKGAPLTRSVSVTRAVNPDTPATGNKSWAEMPVQTAAAGYQFVTHFTTLNGKQVRNYSMCYDKDKHAAQWVAYPLHSCYTTKNTDRTDKWAYDPQIANSYQPYLNNSYPAAAYDRGHQIPSADRLASVEMNEQTFYFSNMTPQVADFNQDIWGDLESMVRDRYTCSDTLYVVTGAYWGEGYKSTNDRNGLSCPVPTHYYKVLLRTKGGSTGKAIGDCSASELKAVGFWMSTSVDPKENVTVRYCKSVAEIEELTGFEFFPAAPDAVKNSYTASDWGL